MLGNLLIMHQSDAVHRVGGGGAVNYSQELRAGVRVEAGSEAGTETMIKPART